MTPVCPTEPFLPPSTHLKTDRSSTTKERLHCHGDYLSTEHTHRSLVSCRKQKATAIVAGRQQHSPNTSKLDPFRSVQCSAQFYEDSRECTSIDKERERGRRCTTSPSPSPSLTLTPCDVFLYSLSSASSERELWLSYRSIHFVDDNCWAELYSLTDECNGKLCYHLASLIIVKHTIYIHAISPNVRRSIYQN